jgi:hypothetical protein
LVTVLITHQTERSQYILTELLGKRLGIGYTVTTNVDEFNATNGAKINYTSTQQPNSLQIIPQGLLLENKITAQHVEVKKNERWHTILWPNTQSQIPFDLFAASFYLLSRYEEYTILERDEHGRFEAKNSLAHKYHFLQFPLVEHWCEELRKQLLDIDSNLEFKQNKFTAITTVDIDFAYLYQGLDSKRWIGKLAKSILKLDIKSMLLQLKSTLNTKQDPYNTYDFIKKTVKGKLGYFVLMSNKGGYDKNIKTDSFAFKHLIKQLHKNSDFIGIHPSYASNQNLNTFIKERNELSDIITQKIEKSRQHFLKINLPDTYRNLIQAGIKEDYTMAYAEQVGFRASTCIPFCFFDLALNKPTTLLCYPTCFMDTTAIQYLSWDSQKIEDFNEKLLNLTKKYNGHYVTLWHNNTFVLPPIAQAFCNLFEKPEFDKIL